MYILSLQDISNACVIWARHTSAIIPYLDEKVILSISKILSSAQPFHIILWLRHFVPSIVHNCPYYMKDIVQWCIEQTYSLQTSELWPEIGLEFINNVHDILKDIIFCFA